MDCASILSPLDANLLAILIGGTIPELPAMIAAGGTMAWLVYLHLGLRLVVGSWFNLEAVWATSLVVVGGLSLAGTILMWRFSGYLLRWQSQLLA